MLSIDRLLGLAGMGSTIANVSMIKQFLSGIAVVVAFTAISGTMAGMLLTAGLYALYVSLMHHGLDPVAAAIMVSSLAVIIMAGFGGVALVQWRQLREIPRLFSIEKPIIKRAHRLAEAFIEGLMTERTRQG